METEVKTETAEAKTKACGVCKASSKSADYELAGLTFTSLEGNPFVCERCVARALGVEAYYNDTVAANLNDRV